MVKLAVNGGKEIRSEPFPPYPMPADQVEIDAAMRVLRSGNLTAQRGPEVKEFDEAFAAYHGVKHSIACGNGTEALHLALAAARIGVGDEVIVPALTFLATGSCTVMNNAIPIFADVEPITLGLDHEAVRALITPRTKAIIVVHLNGYPADMDGLLAVALEHNLIVIEDCAHAHGAIYNGTRVGTLGQMGCFSFQHKKNLSLGEGGAVITNDDGLATQLRAIRSFGGGHLGYNYRMTELHAAIGKVRLERLNQMNAQRQANAAYLDEHLCALPGLTPQEVRANTTSVYYNYVLHYDQNVLGVPKAKFVEALGAEGVLYDIMYVPVYKQNAMFQSLDCYGQGCPWTCPLYGVPPEQRQQYEDGLCPVAEDASDNTRLSVKVHPPCTEREMADVVKAFTKVIENIDELKDT